jgi:hypothetical protein
MILIDVGLFSHCPTMKARIKRYITQLAKMTPLEVLKLLNKLMGEEDHMNLLAAACAGQVLCAAAAGPVADDDSEPDCDTRGAFHVKKVPEKVKQWDLLDQTILFCLYYCRAYVTVAGLYLNYQGPDSIAVLFNDLAPPKDRQVDPRPSTTGGRALSECMKLAELAINSLTDEVRQRTEAKLPFQILVEVQYHFLVNACLAAFCAGNEPRAIAYAEVLSLAGDDLLSYPSVVNDMIEVTVGGASVFDNSRCDLMATFWLGLVKKPNILNGLKELNAKNRPPSVDGLSVIRQLLTRDRCGRHLADRQHRIKKPNRRAEGTAARDADRMFAATAVYDTPSGPVFFIGKPSPIRPTARKRHRKLKRRVLKAFYPKTRPELTYSRLDRDKLILTVSGASAWRPKFVLRRAKSAGKNPALISGSSYGWSNSGTVLSPTKIVVTVSEPFDPTTHPIIYPELFVKTPEDLAAFATYAVKRLADPILAPFTGIVPNPLLLLTGVATWRTCAGDICLTEDSTQSPERLLYTDSKFFIHMEDREKIWEEPVCVLKISPVELNLLMKPISIDTNAIHNILAASGTPLHDLLAKHNTTHATIALILALLDRVILLIN